MSSGDDLVHEFIQPLPSCNPNVPTNVSEIPIDRLSLIAAGTVSSVHVFPNHLDLSILRKSIATLTAVIPTITANYRFSNETPQAKHWLELNAHPISFSTQSSDLEGPYPDSKDALEQAELQPWVSGLEIASNLPNTNQSLISLRYTSFKSGTSCLGVSVGHIIADGNSQLRLVQVLSDIYIHGGTCDHLKPSDYPTFNLCLDIPRTVPPPLDDCRFEYRCFCVENADLPEDRLKRYIENGFANPLSTVSMSLPQTEINALKKKCGDFLGDGIRLSTTDVMAGWFTTLPQRYGGKPYDLITYVINLRGVLEDVPTNFYGNAILSTQIDLSDMKDKPNDTSAGDDQVIAHVAEVAMRIRKNVEKLRKDKDFLREFLPVAAYYLDKVACEGRLLTFAFPEENLYINSFARFDFAVDFGFPKDQVRAHQGNTGVRRPSISLANPQPGKVGEKERDCEIKIEVAKEVCDNMKSIMQRDRERWEKSGVPLHQL